MADRDNILKNLISIAMLNGWHVLPRKGDISNRIDNVAWHVKAGKFITTWDEHIPRRPGFGISHHDYITKHRKDIMTTNDVLFNHSFARYLWGVNEVNSSGFDLTGLRLHFKQVAIWIHDKLYAVPPEKASMVEYKMPPLPKEPLEAVSLDEIKRVTYQLKDIYHTIPVATHQLLDVDLMGTEPNYKHHLAKMAVADDPLIYALQNYPKK